MSNPTVNDSFLQQPLTAIKGIGSAQAELFGKLGLTTCQDLLFHLPYRYEDRSTVYPVASLKLGQTALIEATVVSTDFPPGRKPSLVVRMKDSSGFISLRYYHVFRGLAEKFQVGARFYVFGELRVGSRGLEMYHPETWRELQSSEASLTPVYPLVEGLTQNRVRNAVEAALKFARNSLPDILTPAELAPFNPSGLTLLEALQTVHSPQLTDSLVSLQQGTHPAQRRLIFEELVAHQLSLLKRRQHLQSLPAPRCQPPGRLSAEFTGSLPFQPTSAQQRVSEEISLDLQKSVPMLRLVQGDVGSGKTLVAAMGACQAIESGWQVALMAPTELLAEQHYLNFDRWLSPLGVRVGWISGKLKGKKREITLEALKTGQIDLMIGTHAVFQDQVNFNKLGLIIVDEQHRFGVDQRLALRSKGIDQSPHQLVMTATPIPRTLAMSNYGDLDTSVIDGLPPGRTPVQTVTVPVGRREEVIARLAGHCRSGQQAYWVCTLVEESDVLDAQAAEATFEELQGLLPDVRIGLVHGRMKPEEKQQVMNTFKNGGTQLLIATTVIEVGVDVPNASLMVIENAERLGLSQLHQLRGRVGRGQKESFCVLMYKGPLSDQGKARLGIMRDSNDGFEIAELDLKLRGPGEVLGTRQTGDLGFRVADLMRDQALLFDARKLAMQVLKDSPQRADLLIRRWLPLSAQYAHV